MTGDAETINRLARLQRGQAEILERLERIERQLGVGAPEPSEAQQRLEAARCPGS